MAVQQVTEPVVQLSAQANTNVYLTVTIGNAQIGGSVVKFNGSTTVLGKGTITNLLIGTAAQLSGQTLQVTTNVLDSNDATNNVVVTHTFINTTPTDSVYAGTVENNGDILSFITQYQFQ